MSGGNQTHVHVRCTASAQALELLLPQNAQEFRRSASGKSPISSSGKITLSALHSVFYYLLHRS
jgi:hypothetical protein